MKTEKFNFAARRKEWPLIEKIMGYFDYHPMITMLKDNTRSNRRGPVITLYHDAKPVLSASVGFGLYAATYRFDALHILLHYLEETNASVEWDAVGFSGDPKVISRASKLALLNPITSDIAHYAKIGLRESFVEISGLRESSKNAQVFNAFLANTAIVEILPLDTKRPSRKEQLERVMESVGEAINPQPSHS